MEKTEVRVRPAQRSDIAAIVDIYNAEVHGSTVNYEVRPHSVAERTVWWEGLKEKGYEVLVAEVGGQLAGYCAVGPFHPVTGYRGTATGSVYVARSHRRSGVGKALGRAMVEDARRRGLHTLIGGVNATNTASLSLLEGLGFQRAGYFRQIGRKHDRWHDEICLQIMLEEEKSP